jgi:8-oxo-dGTP diphosphatase
MLHRTKKENDIHEGKWKGLGGKLQDGETPEECAIREIKEECGLNVESLEMKGVLTFPFFNGNDTWYVFLFLINKFSDELIESNEGDLEWIDDNKLFDLNIWEGDKIFMKWLEQDGFFSGKFIYENGKLISHEIACYK